MKKLLLEFFLSISVMICTACVVYLLMPFTTMQYLMYEQLSKL